MKRNHRLCRAAAAVLLALSVAALAGCASKNAGTSPPNPAPQASVPAESGIAAAAGSETAAGEVKTDTGPAAADTGAGAPEADGSIHVHSMEELLDAIAPHANIVIDPGHYNLSETIKDLRDLAIYDTWDEEHPYITLRDCFDGPELVIQDADGLDIRGGSEDPADTELVVDPRYATVLNFERCADPVVAYLTIGHSDGGDCEGNVLSFKACSGIRLNTVDLYGCGVIGIEMNEKSSDLYVFNSTIRDCEYGPFDISNSSGEIVFQDCVMTGNGWGGFYDDFGGSVLRFSGCTFGEMESNEWFFRDDIVREDCVWSEITQYPDYSGMEEYPDVEEQAS